MKKYVWRTWDNRLIVMENLSHQHLSNIYYYVTYTLPEMYDQSTRDEVTRLIETKFGGVILPYKPHPDFVWEKEYLKRKGFLKENDNKIIIDGVKMGEYATT
ncbi:MAG: hypothetical protein WC333_02230 [Dehalococcoidia bacterium]|jgi:hypothetical protein